MNDTHELTVEEKIKIFWSLFRGRTDIHGAYDPQTGRVWQVKQPITRRVVIGHLKGEQPFGIYLLLGDRIHALAVDFDREDAQIPLNFVAASRQYGLPVYIERSKSKGYHGWMFFERDGVLAAPARLVARRILEDIGQPHTEIFPKQDRLDEKTPYGNYINAPLFGALVPQGRTVFLDVSGGLQPYADQWDFLEKIERIPGKQLEQIIDHYDLIPPEPAADVHNDAKPSSDGSKGHLSFGLPPCAQRILREGVQSNQRVSCFRLAIGLKKAGLPYDIALAALKAWSRKNKPDNGKGVITEREIVAQTHSAFRRNYLGCGCQDPAVAPYCIPHQCSIWKKHCGEPLFAAKDRDNTENRHGTN